MLHGIGRIQTRNEKNNFHTHNDHKIDITKFKINWQILYRRPNINKTIYIDNLRNPDTQQDYQQRIKENLNYIEPQLYRKFMYTKPFGQFIC